MNRTISVYRCRPRVDSTDMAFTRDDFKQAMNFEQEVPTCRTCVKAKLSDFKDALSNNPSIEVAPIGHCLIGGFFIYERSCCDVWRDETGDFIVDGIKYKDLSEMIKSNKLEG